MAPNRSALLADVHPQMVRAGGEGDRKPLAADLRGMVAQLVARAIVLSGKTKQEVAFACGYADQGPISRWCSAVERPLFDKLFGVEGFYDAWQIALAERNPNAEVETVVHLHHRRQG